MRLKTEPIDDPAEIILNSDVYPACKGCYLDSDCNIYQPRCERIIAYKAFTRVYNEILGEDNGDPCTGCRNYNECKSNKLACEQFSYFVEGRPVDWWIYRDNPVEYRYDHLFPRDPIALERHKKRSLTCGCS